MTHIEEIEKRRYGLYKDCAEILLDDLDYLLAEVKRMREALRTARGQIVGFSIKEIGAEAAVQNVKYIDDLLEGTQS